MFTFNFMAGFPWETGIEPDASNDLADVYVESDLTKYLRADKNTDKVLPSLSDWHACLLHWKDTGKAEWIIRDKIGVLYSSTNYEDLLVRCDCYNFVARSK